MLVACSTFVNYQPIVHVRSVIIRLNWALNVERC